MPSPNTSFPKSPILLTLYWSIFMCAQLITSSLLAWEIGAQCNFGYNWGYSILNIDQHIQTYAPQNLYKSDFIYTSKDERIKLFEETVTAIQSSGKGLEQISYELPNRTKVSLYTPAEIIHLTDVAHLLDKFTWIWLIGSILWASGLLIIYKSKLAYPTLKNISLGVVALTAISLIVLFLVGPTNFFYWCHTKVFPEGHQWFFYYQESLMSTFMKAPDLFGFIGALLAFALIAIFLVATVLGKYLSRK